MRGRAHVCALATTVGNAAQSCNCNTSGSDSIRHMNQRASEQEGAHMHDSDNGSGIHSSRAATATIAAVLATGVGGHTYVRW